VDGNAKPRLFFFLVGAFVRPELSRARRRARRKRLVENTPGGVSSSAPGDIHRAASFRARLDSRLGLAVELKLTGPGRRVAAAFGAVEDAAGRVSRGALPDVHRRSERAPFSQLVRRVVRLVLAGRGAGVRRWKVPSIRGGYFAELRRARRSKSASRGFVLAGRRRLRRFFFFPRGLASARDDDVRGRALLREPLRTGAPHVVVGGRGDIRFFLFAFLRLPRPAVLDARAALRAARAGGADTTIRRPVVLPGPGAGPRTPHGSLPRSNPDGDPGRGAPRRRARPRETVHAVIVGVGIVLAGAGRDVFFSRDALLAVRAAPPEGVPLGRPEELASRADVPLGRVFDGKLEHLRRVVPRPGDVGVARDRI
jgi:hypothetical protein